MIVFTAIMHIFTCSGSVEATDALIKAGAGVNTKGYNGNTPLILAADRGHTGIAKLLLQHPTIKVHEVVIMLKLLPMMPNLPLPRTVASHLVQFVH